MPFSIEDVVSSSLPRSASGAARSKMRCPTGAIAISVSAVASAMIDGVRRHRLRADRAADDLEHVEIFTNAVTPMKTNGTSETSASATTSAIGFPSRSST